LLSYKARLLRNRCQIAARVGSLALVEATAWGQLGPGVSAMQIRKSAHSGGSTAQPALVPALGADDGECAEYRQAQALTSLSSPPNMS
jgi:hypothetical protein